MGSQSGSRVKILVQLYSEIVNLYKHGMDRNVMACFRIYLNTSVNKKGNNCYHCNANKDIKMIPNNKDGKDVNIYATDPLIRRSWTVGHINLV